MSQSRSGRIRAGRRAVIALAPLYKSVPEAAKLDSLLYERLALPGRTGAREKPGGKGIEKKFGANQSELMTNPNLEMLRIAVENPGELAGEMVFVGGCATGNAMAKEKFPAILIYQFEIERKNLTRRSKSSAEISKVCFAVARRCGF